ncbi:MAG: hypothetical protein H7Y38_03905 [Armatimonadetes bacterium]|nr:hypothetical protein [Armatimonadota bacterium]
MQNLLETTPELDSYLATLGKEIAPLPPEERDAAQVELRQHLEAIVAAETELGTPPAQAVENALTQFGDARTLGKTMRQTWNERLVPTDLHVALVRLHFLTLIPVQLAAPFVVSSSQNAVWGVALLFGINAVVGWNLGKRFPALGSTTVLVYQFAFLLAVPVMALLLLAVPPFGKHWGVVFGLVAMLSLANIFAALCAHCAVMIRAGRFVTYPTHELRLLPRRAHLMVTRRGDASAEVTRQLLRW